VYVCMRGDSRGMDAALAIGEAIGEKSRIVRLPKQLSLVEYMKEHSKDDLERLLRVARGPLETEIELMDPGLVDEVRKQKLLPILKRMASLDNTAIDTLIYCDIKNRFKSKEHELFSYRRLVEEHRARGADH